MARILSIKITEKQISTIARRVIEYYSLERVLSTKELLNRTGFADLICKLLEEQLADFMLYSEYDVILESDKLSKFIAADEKKAEELYEQQRLIAQAQRAEAPVAFLVSKDDVEKVKELLKRGGVKLKSDLG